MIRRCTLILLGSLAAATAMAQQPAQDTIPLPAKRGAVAKAQDNSGYTLNMSTRLVSLDVVVTDAKGKPVDGLTKDDFTIFEGKTLQAIRSFEGSEAHMFPKDVTINSTAELDKKAPNAPVSIIVLDEANTRFEDEAFARYSIKKYLNTQPEHLTQPTALAAINLQHFMMLRDYTTSKSEILSALDHHLSAYPWQLDAGWEAERFDQSFLALSQVAKAVAGHPGHKNMIWIGHGLPTLDLSTVDAETIDTVQSAIDQTTNLLKDSRITLYTVDPAGIQVATSTDIDGNDTDADPFGSSVDFNAMAKATGGLALFGRNDVDNLIGESETAGNHFYTMTYRPSENPSTDKFRNIHVVVNKPGLTVTTRTGYYVPGAPTLMKTAEQKKNEQGTDLLAASDNQMVYDGLPIDVRRDPKDHNEFIIHVPAPGLDWQHDTDPPTTNISILIATFDRKGKLIKREAKIVRVHGRPSAESALPDPAVNLATKVDTTNAVRIRFVIRSGTSGKIGAQNVPCTNGDCQPAS